MLNLRGRLKMHMDCQSIVCTTLVRVQMSGQSICCLTLMKKVTLRKLKNYLTNHGINVSKYKLWKKLREPGTKTVTTYKHLIRKKMKWLTKQQIIWDQFKSTEKIKYCLLKRNIDWFHSLSAISVGSSRCFEMQETSYQQRTAICYHAYW